MGPARILVVDDELYVTTVLSQKLSRDGREVRTASDGAEGLALATQWKPNLIVADFQMPVLSGFEMAVRLRSGPDTADLLLLMLTARGHRLSPAELATTNIRVLVAKPFSVRQLTAKVDELLAAAAPAAA